MLSIQRGFARAGAFAAKVLTMVVLTFLLSCVLLTKAKEARADIVDTDTSKAVAVAYDNSGSMSQGTDRWCTAKYGLEILAAMMGSQDVLHVVPMPTIDGRNTEFVVEGAWPAADRVSKVHNADLGNALQTDPYTAQAALEKLQTAQADEKILLIVTDGKFADMGTPSGIQIVNNIVSQACAEGIQVIYLAIGSEVDLINGGGGVEIEQSGTATEEILETMKTVAEKIYGRARLEGAYNTSDGTLELTAPMGTIIVLAQGEGATVGKLTAADGTSYTPDVATARYSEHPYERLDDKEWAGTNADYYDTAFPNKELVGQVGVFTKNLPAGTYQLETQGSNIEVYYKPNVKISMVLLGENGMTIDFNDLGKSGYVTEGSYTASYQMLDPDTGEVVNSSLLEGGALSIEVTYDGQTSTYGAGDTIVFEPGRPSVTATVELPSNVRVSEKYGSIRVVAEIVPLSIETTGLDEPIDVNTLDEGFSAQLHIAKENGEAITQEEWAQMDISMQSDEDVSWSITKSDTIGEAQAQLAPENKTAAELSEELMGWPNLPIVPSPIRLPSYEMETTINAVVDDDFYPSEGEKPIQVVLATPMPEVIIRAVIVASVLAFILWIIWFFGTWPKLPDGLAPVLVMPMGYPGESEMWFTKRLPERKLVHEKGRFLPRRTTIMKFGPGFIGSSDTISDFIEGCAFELQAVKAEGGVPCFKLSDSTVQALEAMQGSNPPIDPQWKFKKDHPYSLHSKGPTGRGIDPLNDSGDLSASSAQYEIRFTVGKGGK